MLIIFRSQNRNEAIIYSLSTLSEQNARRAANIPVSFTFDLKQKGLSFYIHCKIICKLFHASS